MNLPDQYLGQPRGLPTTLGATMPPPDAAPFDRINLDAIMAILRRRFWLLMRIIALCLALAVLITINMPVHYMATADVELRTLPPSSTNDQTGGQTLDDPGGVRIDTVDTELQVIQSRALSGKVFDKLKLDQNRAFMKEALTKWSPTAIIERMVMINPGLKKGAANPVERRALAIDYMISQISATRIITTAYAVHINYSDSDQFLAAKIANAYASGYAFDQVVSKKGDNDQAVVSLKGRIQGLADQARADFAREQRYRIEHNLLSMNATSLTEQEVSTYNQQVAVARAEAAHDRSAFDNARRQLLSGSGAAGEVQDAALITSLRGQRATISARLADLSSRFLDGHPDVLAARQQLRDIDGEIAIEIDRSLQTLDAKAKASESRLSSLQSSLGAANGTLSHNNGSMIALDDLHRRSEASEATYDTYLGRYKNAVAKSGAELPDSRVISMARPPFSPSSPVWLLNIVLGLLLGLILGGTAAVLTETNFTGLTTGNEVEQRLGLPYFGAVPKLNSVKPHSASPLETIRHYPGGAFAEALRGVLAAARQSGNGRNQVIGLTSALPDEGKTTLAACMARLAGMAGERVCLIDCDAVRAGLSKLFPDAQPGLREYFEDGFTADSILPIDDAGNVSVISILGAFPEGTRLNEQGRLHRLLAKLRERFDLIILDLPPVLPIAEARELAGLADNVVFVARWRKSSEVAMRAALRLLPLQHIAYIGVTLNLVDMRKRMQIGGAETFYRQYQQYYPK